MLLCCLQANFKDTNLQGAYFMKAVVFEADFTNANLSDTLMDRAGSPKKGALEAVCVSVFVSVSASRKRGPLVLPQTLNVAETEKSTQQRQWGRRGGLYVVRFRALISLTQTETGLDHS